MIRVTTSVGTAGLVKKHLLLAGVIVSAVALVGTRAFATDASDIQNFAPSGSGVTYDDASGDFPVITAIVSQPGTTGGHLYTGWSVLAQDASGSIDLFISQVALTGAVSVVHNATSFSVGDAVSAQGQYSPFHSEAEIAFTTIAASNNFLNVQSSGNALPTPPGFTVNQLNAVSDTTNNPAVSGMYLEIQNATISGSTGSFQSTFPTFAQANTVNESYTITDGTGSMVLFDFVTSDSANAAMGGTAVPTGPVNVFGFMSVFPSTGLPGGGLPEFTPLSFQAVPEPSTVVLVSAGLLGLLAIRRRRS